MWPNNNFGRNGQFQNNFSQDEQIPSPFANGLPGSMPGQQFIPQHLHPSNVNSSNSDNFNGFQPNAGFYNNSAFMQNQQQLNSGSQFSPRVNVSLPAPSTTPRPTTQINARAAELKAQLLKGREGRASSATPNLMPGTNNTKLGGSGEGPSLRSSPAPPVALEAREDELNVDDLISQYAPSKPPRIPIVKVEEKNSNALGPASSQKPSLPIIGSAKSLAPPAGSPAGFNRVNKEGNKRVEHASATDIKHESNGDISEGEILEEQAPKEVLPPTGPKQASIKKIEAAERRRQSVDQLIKSTQDRGARAEEPRRAPPPLQPKIQLHNRDDRRDERSDARGTQSDYRADRRPPELETRGYDRYDPRDRYEDRERYEEYRRLERAVDRGREDAVKIEERPSKKPTLTEFLATDPDLKEWLDATNYFNKEYRDKILNHRRKLAALDAERERLLAEMGGGVPGVGLASSMLVSPTESEPRNGSTDTAALPRDRVPSNKRPHNEIQDGRDDNPAKVARINDRNHEDERPKVRPREDADMDRRPGGYDSYRMDRRDSRDEMRGVRYEDGRGRRRSLSRERELSPYYRYEPERFPSPGRLPERRRSFDSGDRRAPFDIRGGFRGRGYDSAFRGGRGRGRGGRGDYSGLDYSEPKNESPFGTRIAASKAWKGPRPFDKGRKGETRYFIVKSFNEENVLNCIEDGIWTTQLANGPPLTTAFNASRNVILVFSINKSRAFQGFARMESLPGSIPMPDWQKAINWESAGAFKVLWLVICSTRFHRVGHLKNGLNEGQAVLIGKDGQEIEGECGERLCGLIEEEGEGKGWSAEARWRESA